MASCDKRREKLMTTRYVIDDGFIAEQNQKARDWIEEDYEHLARKLRRQSVDIEDLVAKAKSFRVAIPSWGVGTGGSPFEPIPRPGQPPVNYHKVEEWCSSLNRGRSTPCELFQPPYDKPQNPPEGA